MFSSKLCKECEKLNSFKNMQFNLLYCTFMDKVGHWIVRMYFKIIGIKFKHNWTKSYGNMKKI